jgi:UDP-glucose 4-epimerase
MGTLRLLDLCAESGVKRFIHASTGSVYGQPVTFPQTEEHPRNPTTAYGISKTAAESYVQWFNGARGMHTTILRYFHVYGPKQNSEPGQGGVVGVFAKNVLMEAAPILDGGGSQERAFTYVDDIVAANMLVLDKPEADGQVYNCCSGVSITVKELGRKIICLLKPGTQHFSFRTAPAQVGEVYNFDVSNEKLTALSEGQFTWTQLDDGLEETIEWYRQRLKRS